MTLLNTFLSNKSDYSTEDLYPILDDGEVVGYHNPQCDIENAWINENCIFDHFLVAYKVHG